MRTGPRLVLAAVATASLIAPAPAALAKGAAKKPAATAKAPALTLDVARIEPLGAPSGAPVPTVTLEGVGEYRGLMEVRRTAAGVGVVNDVALDDYLKGISEVPSSWPAETLRAQAIASRTYLLYVLGLPPAGDAAALGAQICATESCQVYTGIAKEAAAGGANWAAAVRDTAGLAVLSAGAPILAKYSACSGGRSVSGGKPYLKAVDDPDDARCPLYRWALGVSYDDIGRALAVPGAVKAVRATAADVSVDWTDSGGGRLTVPRTEFRAKVGAAVAPPPERTRTVPSTQFDLRGDDASRTATLAGRGFGHGIGMSQWGAYGKGLRGLRATAILAAYYGGLQPMKVPPARLPARVRVALAGGPETVVSASGPFRITDGRGSVVVPVATGAWKVVPAGKGVRLVPPRDQAGPPGVSLTGVEPAVPLPGGPLVVRFRSNLPGYATATAQGPGGAEAPGGAEVTVLARTVIGTEERRLTLPAATRPGVYSLSLSVDSGAGRTVTDAFAIPVLNLGSSAPPSSGAGPAGGPAQGLGPVGPGGSSPPAGGLGALASGARSTLAGRASRSSALRPRASHTPAPAADASGPGLLLAAASGFALWHFRARRRVAG